MGRTRMKAIGAILAIAFVSMVYAQDTARSRIGMNLDPNAFWSDLCMWKNLMLASSAWRTSNADYSAYTDEEKARLNELKRNLPRDSCGYLLEVPASVPGFKEQCVSTTLPTGYPAGRYVMTWKGEGTFRLSGAYTIVSYDTTNKKMVMEYDGGVNTSLSIRSSESGNHLRDIAIYEEKYDGVDLKKRPFRDEILQFAEDFHCIRFMQTQGTNSNWHTPLHWEQRRRPWYYTQETSSGGIATEYLIDFCNTVKADPWICIPHTAWDDYMIECARVVKERLDPGLKCYFEFSNEMWNWAGSYPQSHWVGQNGQRGDSAKFAHDTVTARLKQIGDKYCPGNPEAYCHPEKDAYMMARMFRHLESVFDGADRSRLVCVAGIQGWGSRRILEYLFEDDGVGCDVVSPASYFSFSKTASARFDSLPEGSVSVDMLLDSVENSMYSSLAAPDAVYDNLLTDAEKYGVGIVCYEGGSHMYRYDTHHWDSVLTASYTHPRMYDIYRKNIAYWERYLQGGVNVHFSATGGHFSHLNSWDEVYLQGEELRAVNPKYAALLDANAPREISKVVHGDASDHGRIGPDAAVRVSDRVFHFTAGKSGRYRLELRNLLGARLVSYDFDYNSSMGTMRRPIDHDGPGYFIAVVKDTRGRNVCERGFLSLGEKVSKN